MDLTLKAASQLTGKSVRQLRYLVQLGKLPSKKVNGAIRIRRADLPLSSGQAIAQTAKEKKADGALKKALSGDQQSSKAEDLQKVITAKTRDRKGLSVRTLRATQVGIEILRAFNSTLSAEHEAISRLREALALLACGWHAYHPEDKLRVLRLAREEASRSAMLAMLEPDPLVEWTDKLELEFIPAIGGLIRRAEMRLRASKSGRHS